MKALQTPPKIFCPKTGVAYTLRSSEFIIGSGLRCDLLVPDRVLPQLSAKINILEDGTYLLRQLDKRVNVRLNGRLVNKARIIHRDKFRIGVWGFIFLTESSVPTFSSFKVTAKLCFLISTFCALLLLSFILIFNYSSKSAVSGTKVARINALALSDNKELKAKSLKDQIRSEPEEFIKKTEKGKKSPRAKLQSKPKQVTYKCYINDDLGLCIKDLVEELASSSPGLQTLNATKKLRILKQIQKDLRELKRVHNQEQWEKILEIVSKIEPLDNILDSKHEGGVYKNLNYHRQLAFTNLQSHSINLFHLAYGKEPFDPEAASKLYKKILFISEPRSNIYEKAQRNLERLKKKNNKGASNERLSLQLWLRDLFG